jgi:hypothetical protein
MHSSKSEVKKGIFLSGLFANRVVCRKGLSRGQWHTWGWPLLVSQVRKQICGTVAPDRAPLRFSLQQFAGKDQESTVQGTVAHVSWPLLVSQIKSKRVARSPQPCSLRLFPCSTFASKDQGSTVQGTVAHVGLIPVGFARKKANV